MTASGKTDQPEPSSGEVPLPTIETALDESAIVERLTTLSRRGKLAEFATGDAVEGGPGLFSVEAFGSPFDHRLVATSTPRQDGGCVLDLRLFRRRLVPTVFAVVLVLTVWPGVNLTDSLLSTYWKTYGAWSVAMPWLTYAWYLPLTVLPIPWAWKIASKRSRIIARASADEMIAKITKAIDGETKPDG